MRTFLPLGEALPDRGGRSSPRWMLRAEVMAARLMMVAEELWKGTDAGILEVEFSGARANFW